jgi:hypothetical protein
MATGVPDGRTIRPDNATLQAWRARIAALLLAPDDIAGIVCFRIAFGALMVWEAWRFADLGWIREYYVDPPFHFTYLGLDWVRPWPGDGMYLHFAAMALFAVGITIGAWYRLSAALFFVAYTYVFLLDQATFNNHYYLISLLSFLMVFLPAERALSVDAWRRPRIRSTTAPGWVLWTLRAAVAIPYLYGALAKLKDDWLRGQPMGLWLANATDVPLVGRWFLEPWAPLLFSWGGLLFDLLIVPALLWPRTRAVAFVAALLFHVTNAWLFPIGVFPPLMIAATTLFLPPSWPREFGFRWPLAAAPPAAAVAKAPVAANAGPPSPVRVGGVVVAVVLLGFFAVQLLLPLRHFAYPGPVMWTEEGLRFAWHMRLRDKWGEARFHVSDPATGQRWVVDPDDELASFQEVEMASKPDMLLQYAHHLARRWEAAGHPGVEVRAETMVSLNGRDPQPLVDPTVDLARQPRDLGHATWIMPLTEPLSD